MAQPNSAPNLSEKIQNSIATVEKFLVQQQSKKLNEPFSATHSFDDSFELVRYLSHVACFAVVQSFITLGVDFWKMVEFAREKRGRGRQILQYQTVEECEFVRNFQRKHSQMADDDAGAESKLKTKHSVWVLCIHQCISLVFLPSSLLSSSQQQGEQRVVILEKKSVSFLEVEGEERPLPKKRMKEPTEIDLTWFLGFVDGAVDPPPSSSSSSSPCFPSPSLDFFLPTPPNQSWQQKQQHSTPRRNQTTEEVLSFFSKFLSWSKALFTQMLRYWDVGGRSWGNFNSWGWGGIGGSQEGEPVGELRSEAWEEWEKRSLLGLFVPVLPVYCRRDNDEQVVERGGGEEERGEGEEVEVEFERKTTTSRGVMDWQGWSTLLNLQQQSLLKLFLEIDKIWGKSKPTKEKKKRKNKGKKEEEEGDDVKKKEEDGVAHYREKKQILSLLKSLPRSQSDVKKLSIDLKIMRDVWSARLLVVFHHLHEISRMYLDSIDLIEQMLYNRIIAAIGYEVRSDDFNEYLDFHTRHLFRNDEAVCPTAMSKIVRRPDCSASADGVLGMYVGRQLGGRGEGLHENHPLCWNPIKTVSREWQMSMGMRVKLNAAVEICLKGKMTVHGYFRSVFKEDVPKVTKRKGNGPFSSGGQDKLVLSLQAKEFSSFLLLICRVRSNRYMEIEHGVIIQNNEEYLIPLKLSMIPSAKEFQRAISSLSPSQQKFSTLFRSLQLSDSLFALCVLPIKPQLERVFNLVDGDLTKEVELCEELLRLLLEYQISPELLSCKKRVDRRERSGGEERRDPFEEEEGREGKKGRGSQDQDKIEREKRVQEIKINCQHFFEMIEKMKQEDLKEKELEQQDQRLSLIKELAVFTRCTTIPTPTFNFGDEKEVTPNMTSRRRSLYEEMGVVPSSENSQKKGKGRKSFLEKRRNSLTKQKNSDSINEELERNRNRRFSLVGNQINNFVILGHDSSGRSTFFRQTKRSFIGESSSENGEYERVLNINLLQAAREILILGVELMQKDPNFEIDLSPKEVKEVLSRAVPLDSAPKFKSTISKVWCEVQVYPQCNLVGAEKVGKVERRWGGLLRYFTNYLWSGDRNHLRGLSWGVREINFRFRGKETCLRMYGGKELTFIPSDPSTTILFLIAITSYHEMDSSGENLLRISLNSLLEVARCCPKNRIRVVFTKEDLLQKTLNLHPFCDSFPEFSGENTVVSVQSFLKYLIKSEMPHKPPKIFHVNCCGYSSSFVRNIFEHDLDPHRARRDSLLTVGTAALVLLAPVRPSLVLAPFKMGLFGGGGQVFSGTGPAMARDNPDDGDYSYSYSQSSRNQGEETKKKGVKKKEVKKKKDEKEEKKEEEEGEKEGYDQNPQAIQQKLETIETEIANLPQRLEDHLTSLDAEAPLRPTLFHVDSTIVWEKVTKKERYALAEEHQIQERKKCLDFLDAVTKSGIISLEGCHIHTVVGYSHCFEKSVMRCVVEDGMNPIDAVERSQLMFASHILGVSMSNLVQPHHLERLHEISPDLF